MQYEIKIDGRSLWVSAQPCGTSKAIDSLQLLALRMHQFSGDAKDSRRARRSSGGAGVFLSDAVGREAARQTLTSRRDVGVAKLDP